MKKVYILFFLIAYYTNALSQTIKLDDMILVDSTKLVLLENNNEILLVNQSIVDTTKVDTLMKNRKIGELMDYNLTKRSCSIIFRQTDNFKIHIYSKTNEEDKLWSKLSTYSFQVNSFLSQSQEMIFLEDSIIVKRPKHKVSEKDKDKMPIVFFVIKENEEIDAYTKVSTYLSDQKSNANWNDRFKNRKNNPNEK